MTQRNRKLQARIEQQEQGHDGRRRETRPPRALTGCRLLDAGVPARQAERVQTGLLSYRWHAQWRHLLSAPCIYLVAVPPGMRDLFISLCQLVCFPLYRTPSNTGARSSTPGTLTARRQGMPMSAGSSPLAMRTPIASSWKRCARSWRSPAKSIMHDADKHDMAG